MYYVFIFISVYISIQVLHLSPTPSPHKLPSRRVVRVRCCATRARCLQTSFPWGHPSMLWNPAGALLGVAGMIRLIVSQWIRSPENSLRFYHALVRPLMGGMISFQKHGICSYGTEDSSRCQPNSGMICHGLCLRQVRIIREVLDPFLQGVLLRFPYSVGDILSSWLIWRDDK